MNSVPFTIEGVYSNFAELEGIVRMDEAGLLLEFRVTDSFVHILKSQPKEVRISWPDLEEVSFKAGYFRRALYLRARTMTALASIPGSGGSEVSLRCKRKYAQAAQELASNAGMRIVEHQLRVLTGLNRSSAPPAPQA